MLVFPVQVSSPSSLLLWLSSEAEGQARWRSQRNEREGCEAHSDLWYELSSTSTVGSSINVFVIYPFLFCQRRIWTAKLRMKSRWWRWWDFLLLTPLRFNTMIALFCAATRRCSEFWTMWLLPCAIKLKVSNVFSFNTSHVFHSLLSQVVLHTTVFHCCRGVSFFSWGDLLALPFSGILFPDWSSEIIWNRIVNYIYFCFIFMMPWGMTFGATAVSWRPSSQKSCYSTLWPPITVLALLLCTLRSVFWTAVLSWCCIYHQYCHLSLTHKSFNFTFRSNNNSLITRERKLTGQWTHLLSTCPWRGNTGA